MKENTRNKAPFIFAPRDKNGNKMIWDEDKKEYVEDAVIYAKPMLIAPRDRNGKAMVWDEEEKIYKSTETGQLFSTVLMKFVEEEPEISVENMAEFDEPLNSLDDEDVSFGNIDALFEKSEDDFDEIIEEVDDFEQQESDLMSDFYHGDSDEELLREEECMMMHRGQLASGYADGDFWNDFGDKI